VHEQFDVQLLPANDDRWRMLARGGEVRAIGGTRNLGETLCSAANGANLLPESGAAASGAPFVAQGTNHVAQYCIIGPKNTQNSSERRLQTPVVYVAAVAVVCSRQAIAYD
jgi:hypothetical protein